MAARCRHLLYLAQVPASPKSDIAQLIAPVIGAMLLVSSYLKTPPASFTASPRQSALHSSAAGPSAACGIDALAAHPAQIDRAEDGSFKDCKPIKDGVQDMRIDYGPGYRMYFVGRGPEIVALNRYLLPREDTA